MADVPNAKEEGTSVDDQSKEDFPLTPAAFMLILSDLIYLSLKSNSKHSDPDASLDWALTERFVNISLTLSVRNIFAKTRPSDSVFLNLMLTIRNSSSLLIIKSG